MGELAAMIRARRGILQLSQAKAAKSLAVGISTYQNWETGTSFPNVLAVPKLAEWLEIEPIEIERLRGRAKSDAA